MSHDAGDSKKAILAALGANVGIGVMKVVAFAFTGLSSMLSEAIHSFADCGNEVLLLIGGRQSKQQATDAHPFGHGRARYIFSFLVAIVLFTAGGLFALFEAYEKISESLHGEAEHGLEGWKAWVPIAVLVGSMILEGWSLKAAADESVKIKGKLSWYGFIRKAKNPELPVVLLENLAAVIGLSFALAAVSLTLITGNPIYDGIGAALIGVLLTVMALVLMVEMYSLLVGAAASEGEQEAITAALIGTDGIERVIYLKTQHLSPEEVLVAAKVAIDPTDSGGEIAHIINAAEEAIRAVVPTADQIFIEPDVWEENHV